MISPEVWANPRLIACDWPRSLRMSQWCSRSRYLSSTAAVESVEPPSCTTYWSRGYCWSSTLRMVRSRNGPWLYDGVTTEISGGSGSAGLR